MLKVTEKLFNELRGKSYDSAITYAKARGGNHWAELSGDTISFYYHSTRIACYVLSDGAMYLTRNNWHTQSTTRAINSYQELMTRKGRTCIRLDANKIYTSTRSHYIEVTQIVKYPGSSKSHEYKHILATRDDEIEIKAEGVSRTFTLEFIDRGLYQEVGSKYSYEVQSNE